MTVLDHALRMAEYGWEVFAIGSKQPYAATGPFCDEQGRGGFYAATTEPDVLGWQFEQHPDSGLALRPPERVAVLDIDRPEALGNRKVGATLVAFTPRGYHVFHWWPYDPRPAVGLLPGIDLKSRDSYVRIAPTAGYQWAPTAFDYLESEQPLGDAPDWLLKLRPEDTRPVGTRRDLLQVIGPLVDNVTSEAMRLLDARHTGGGEYSLDEYREVVEALMLRDLSKPSVRLHRAE